MTLLYCSQVGYQSINTNGLVYAWPVIVEVRVKSGSQAIGQR